MSFTSLVHIGDFHAGPGPRNADRYRALDQIIEEARRLPTLGAWLWPGDLNHGRMTIEDRNALAERLTTMAQCAPVVIAYGNHDLPGDLEIFGRIKAMFPVSVIATPQVVTVPMPTDHTLALFVLPYPTKAGLASIGVAPGEVIQEASDSLDLLFMHAAGELAQAYGSGCLTAMIGHVNVAGSATSVGQPNIGREIEITASHLDRLSRVYKGLNHIHKAQEIGGAHYAGSVCRLNWGEVEEKRWIEVRCARDAWTAVSHVIDVPPMYHVDGVLSRDGFTWEVPVAALIHCGLCLGSGCGEQPANADVACPHCAGKGYPCPDFAGSEVRVRYRFKQSERGALDHASVRVPFESALRVEVEGIAEPDRALRAPEVAQARTLTEKLTAWAHVAGEVCPESVLAKLALLEHSDPQVLLSQVTNRVEGARELAVAS